LSDSGYRHSADDWLRASAEDNVEVIKRYLADGFAVDTRGADGNTALHAAAAGGAEKVAALLLEQGLAVDLRGGGGRTPLMTAALSNQPRMVRWLLRQGAGPRLKDQDGYTPLMLAVRENATKVVGELALQVREDLDAALLAAALQGRAEMIDELTKYGASVHARMEDGRTALMLAAQNNHQAAVRILLELGGGRFATTAAGLTAADLATAEGHQQLAALILAQPATSELTLESPEILATAMDAEVEAAAAPEQPATAATGQPPASAAAAEPPSKPSSTTAAGTPTSPHRRRTVESIDGKTLARAEPAPAATGPAGAEPAEPNIPSGAPIIMRHYRQREMPLEILTVSADTATLRIIGQPSPEVKVRAGDTLPGSSLIVVKVQRRVATTKENEGKPVELSVVEFKDPATSPSRQPVKGLPASAPGPRALVSGARPGTGSPASPGQRFHDADGREYRVADVRPNQLVIEDTAAGTVQTLPLRGPRG